MALDDILAEPESTLEWAVELSSVKRSDGTAKTWYYTTLGRETLSTDTPASTTMQPYLKGLGQVSQTLQGDQLFSGLAPGTVGEILLRQSGDTTDQLDDLLDYTFAGYTATIKVGKASATSYSADFFTFRTAVIDAEPTLSANAASFRLQSVLARLLAEPLIVDRYVGIPTCVNGLTTTGSASAPYISAYDLTSFTLMARWNITSNPATFPAFTHKQNSGTDRNWFFGINNSGGKVLCQASIGGVSTTFHLSTADYCDGNYHVGVWSVQNATTSYLMVDGEVDSTFTPSGAVALPAAANVMKASYVGKLLDVRIYSHYMPPDEARAWAAVRSDGDDLGCVGLWRFDDNTGTTANDYSSNNNDAPISGVVNTDWAWAESDLGEPELAGQPYPVVVGEVLNAKAHLIDQARERYRGNNSATGWHSSGSNTNLTVRSRGVVLTGGGTDYTAPSDGGGGVFSMTAAEDEPVTFDLRSSGTAEESFYVSDVADDLVSGYTRIASSDIDLDRVSALRVLCPWLAGYWTDTDATVQQGLDALLASSGLCYYENNSGDLYMDMVLPPLGYGVLTVDVGLAASIDGACLDMRGGGGVTFTGCTASPTAVISIGAWFKTNIIDQTGYALGGSEPNVGSITIVNVGNVHLYFQAVGTNAGKIRCSIGGTISSTPVGLIQAGRWYYIGMRYTDATNVLNFFVGDEDGTWTTAIETTNAGVATSGTTYVVGSTTGGKDAWSSVRDVSVLSTEHSLSGFVALSSTARVQTGYNSTTMPFWAPLNEGDGSPVEKQANVTGTMSGPQWAPKVAVNLDDTPSVSLSNYHYLMPAWKVVVRYARNQLPMSDADIATSVTQSNRLDLRREWKSASWRSDTARDRYKGSRSIELDSPITDRESAQRLVRALATKFSDSRTAGDLSFPPGLAVSRRAMGLRLNDEVGVISANRYGLSAGKSFRVVVTQFDPMNLTARLALWG